MKWVIRIKRWLNGEAAFIDYKQKLLDIRQTAISKRLINIQTTLEILHKNDERTYSKFLLMEANHELFRKNLADIKSEIASLTREIRLLNVGKKL